MGKGNPLSLVMGLQTGATILEVNMENHQNTKNKYDPAIPLLGIYSTDSTSQSTENY